jgi:hypothetical protein
VEATKAPPKEARNITSAPWAVKRVGRSSPAAKWRSFAACATVWARHEGTRSPSLAHED